MVANSAQRLTASKELEPNQPQLGYGQSNVLNALRHQRNWNLLCVGSSCSRSSCSTPYGIKGIGTAASSACFCSNLKCSTPYGIKGIGTLTEGFIMAALGKCSTPYGIKGIGTGKEVHEQLEIRWVLNALRHQRNWNATRQQTTGEHPRVLNALRHQRNWNLL